jgi:hypothetical protein
MAVQTPTDPRSGTIGKIVMKKMFDKPAGLP